MQHEEEIVQKAFELMHFLGTLREKPIITCE